MLSVLLILPALVSAADNQESRARSIFNMVIERLCQLQEAHGNRVRLVDPARCVPTPPPPIAPTLTLQKTVINDNGGTATTTDFQARIDGGNVSWGVAQTVSVGSHTASEMTLPNYTAGAWGGDCAADGTITLAAGENKTCMITNDDVAQEPTTGHLIVDKVTQPSGNTRVFDITATGTGAITGGGAGTTTDAVNKQYEVMPGTYSVEETVPSGWMQVTNTCTDVVVAAGETETCVITNAKLPTLTLMKTVVNDNGGTAVAADFQAKVDGGDVAWNSAQMLTVGTHTASETVLAGYSAGAWSGDCAADGTITLAAGDDKVCTITNDDIPPPPFPLDMIFISEIAWMGTVIDGATSTDAEWMELMNTGSEAIDLSGWTLNATDGTPEITIDETCANTVIPGNDFFLLVRTDDSILGVPADCTYTGALENNPAAENLELRNAGGDLIDNVPATDSGGWVAGDNTTKETMTRTSSETWATAVPTPGS